MKIGDLLYFKNEQKIAHFYYGSGGDISCRILLKRVWW